MHTSVITGTAPMLMTHSKQARSRRAAVLLAATTIIASSACAAKAPPKVESPKPSANDPIGRGDARAFFEHYVELSRAFDPALVELYGDDASITTDRVELNGTRRLSASGAQWKEWLRRALPIAREHGDVAQFSAIELTEVPEGTRISAQRYSAVKCTRDLAYFMLLKRSPQGAVQIAQEHTTTYAASLCGLGSDKSLQQRLDELVGQVAPALPLKLDDETVLESVIAVDHELTYNFKLVSVSPGELDQFKSALSEMSIDEICTTPQLQPALDAGARVIYNYHDRADEGAHRNVVERSTCGASPKTPRASKAH